MKAPFQTSFLMESPLPASECEQRLREASVSKWAVFKSRDEYPFVGKFEGEEIVLKPRLSPFFNNSWTRFFYLRLCGTSSGCLIEGKIALPNLILIFSVFWCGIAGLFFMGILVGTLHARELSKDSLLPLVPLGMLIFFALMTKFGLWLSGFTERRCATFLEEKLHGRQVDVRMLPQALTTS